LPHSTSNQFIARGLLDHHIANRSFYVHGFIRSVQMETTRPKILTHFTKVVVDPVNGSTFSKFAV